MFALSVKLDEVRGQVSQRTSCRKVAIDEGPTAPLRGNFAPDNDFTDFRDFGAAFENRLDARGWLAGPDEVARRAAAKQQPDGLYQNRLAGAGFAGQDVQAGIEFDLDRIDDREVGNA